MHASGKIDNNDIVHATRPTFPDGLPEVIV